MDNVIDFELERAYLKSGIKDRELLKDMIKEGYNPCNSDDVEQYHRWDGFLNTIQNTELPDQHYWSEDSLKRLWNDIQHIDSSETYTVTYDTEDLWTLEDTDEDFIFEPDLSAFFKDDK